MDRKFLLPGLFSLIIVLVYRAWIFSAYTGGGDFPYYFSSQLSGTVYPFLWTTTQNMGGYGATSLVNIFPISPLIIFLITIFKVQWTFIAKIIYFYPTLLLGILCLFYLYRTIEFSKHFIYLALGIFLFNTYILMIHGGGQMLLALAISVVPAILAIVLKLTSSLSFRNIFILGGLYALEIGLDLRITYILIFTVIIFILVKAIVRGSWKYLLQSFGNFILLPLIITGFFHMFWILPTIMVHQNPFQQLGTAYSSTEAVKYFSFAKFENTFGLLHPNWPENIFGKVSFMKPEFLLLPILAFSSLLFINKKVKNEEEEKEKFYVIYFVLLGLIGIFLAKGANDPFGDIYLWMFNHVPGFIMFRDPTKWYLLIVLSYSMLIPFSVGKIYNYLKRKFV